jgi:hypothetical protein
MGSYNVTFLLPVIFYWLSDNKESILCVSAHFYIQDSKKAFWLVEIHDLSVYMAEQNPTCPQGSIVPASGSTPSAAELSCWSYEISHPLFIISCCTIYLSLTMLLCAPICHFMILNFVKEQYESWLYSFYWPSQVKTVKDQTFNLLWKPQQSSILKWLSYSENKLTNENYVIKYYHASIELFFFLKSRISHQKHKVLMVFKVN